MSKIIWIPRFVQKHITSSEEMRKYVQPFYNELYQKDKSLIGSSWEKDYDEDVLLGLLKEAKEKYDKKYGDC